MTDKISNGDFFLPNILGFQGEVGGIQYYDTFSEGQKDIFIWVGSDGDLSIENNDNGMTSSGYPNISLLNIQGASGVNLYQYVSFQNLACLYQSLNLTKIGVYNLSFLYVSRPNFVLNNLQIFLNDLLLDVISTPQTSWTEYTYSFPVSTTGNYKLFFQGQPDITDTYIGITNIKLIEPPTVVGGGGITVYNNNFKSTVINGYLKVVDISGTIGHITTNFLTCNKNLTMPANGTNSIYYRDISSNIIGRLFGTQLQMYMDYYNIMSFRNCKNNGSVTGVKLILNDKGIVINSSTTSSNFNLDVYGNAGAYIRGPLRVLNDILYSDSISLVSTLGGYNTSINTLSGRIFTISGGLNTANLNITSISGRLNTANTDILSLSGLVYTNTNTSSITTLSGQITSISGRLNTATTDIISISGLINTATTNITSISGLINNATTNITSISGLINTANTNITTISGLINTANTNITSISGLINTANTNITTISGLINTANTNITSISGRLNTISGTVNSISGTVNSINSAGTYSTASIIANGFVRATRFELTNRTNIIYQSTIIGNPANYSFPSGTAQTILVSNLPAGLYIMCFSLNVLNTGQSAVFSNIRFQLTSSDGFAYFEEYVYNLTLPASQRQTFSRMCMVNNPGTYNFTLTITPTYTGSTGLTWMSTSGNAPANKTFLQFTRIG